MKILLYFTVGLLLLSVFATLDTSKGNVEQMETINLQFLEPIIMKRDQYVELNVKGANACLHHGDKPILPIYTKTMSLQFGTKIVDIECEIQKVETMVITEKILPAPQLVIQGTVTNAPEYKMNEEIYNSDDFFPENWYNYYTGGGLDENDEQYEIRSFLFFH